MFIVYIFVLFLVLNFLWEVLRTLATRSAAKVPVAKVTSVASATENKRKLVYLSQSRPVMTENYYTEARDRLCKKAGISPFDWSKYQAVQVKAPSGWFVTIRKI